MNLKKLLGGQKFVILGKPGRVELLDRATGLSRPTILAARVAFTVGSREFENGKKRKCSRRALTPEVEQKILDTALNTRPAHADAVQRPSTGRKVGCVAHDGTARLAALRHPTPTGVEKFKISRDPNFREKVRDVVGLYLDPPDRALVLCVVKRARCRRWGRPPLT
jgi:hypothetical protein